VVCDRSDARLDALVPLLLLGRPLESFADRLSLLNDWTGRFWCCSGMALTVVVAIFLDAMTFFGGLNPGAGDPELDSDPDTRRRF
jgi:hypothetical protein